MLVLAVKITWSLSPCLLDLAILGFSYCPASLVLAGGLLSLHPQNRIGNTGSFSRQAVQDMPNAGYLKAMSHKPPDLLLPGPESLLHGQPTRLGLRRGGMIPFSSAILRLILGSPTLPEEQG